MFVSHHFHGQKAVFRAVVLSRTRPCAFSRVFSWLGVAWPARISAATRRQVMCSTAASKNTAKNENGFFLIPLTMNPQQSSAALAFSSFEINSTVARWCTAAEPQKRRRARKRRAFSPVLFLARRVFSWLGVAWPARISAAGAQSADPVAGRARGRSLPTLIGAPAWC